MFTLRCTAATALRILVLVGTLALVGCGQASNGPVGLAQYVNPLIGTSNGGDTFPGADVPFGMIQWSPETGAQRTIGGYTYNNTQLRGFALTELSGAGCSAYGDIPILPFTGPLPSSPSTATVAFSHQNERAWPGYYGVTLSSGVQAQLTVTERSGIGTFAYPTNGTAGMLFKVSGSANGVSASSVTIVSNDEVQGSATSGHFCGTGDVYTVYFTAVFKEPFRSFGVYEGDLAQSGARTASGTSDGAYVEFAPGTDVQMKVGISFVSAANALGNIKASDPGWNFAAVRNQALKTWNQLLGHITVTGGTTSLRTVFYTALYHSLLQPNVFSDANGQYMGFDDKVHTLPKGETQYANFSGWDIYRSETQLLSLLAPQETGNMIQSLLNDAEQGGWLPKWPLANGYTGVMNGDSADAIIADAYSFGVTNFNTKTALTYMLKGATQAATSGYVERPGLAAYLEDGFEPAQAANTLEYNTDDFAIAQFAKALGKTKTYQTFMQRSQGWVHLVDQATGFLEPALADGAFPSGFDPNSVNGYREGDAYQYTWDVPFNLSSLFGLLGGDQAVSQRLDSFFTQLNAGQTASYYWAGNEPGLEIPWEYDFLGEPYQTENVVREIQDQLYTDNPGGLPGNDDLGAMSSWYVWSALGMYPEIPGVADLVLSTPLFPSATIHLPNGKTFQINAAGASPDRGYILAATLGGKAYNQDWVPLGTIEKGGTLADELSTAANQSTVNPLIGFFGLTVFGAAPMHPWAASPADEPPSFGTGMPPASVALNPATPVVSLGQSTTVTVSITNLTASSATVDWSASPPSGIQLSTSTGNLSVAADQTAAISLSLSTNPSTATGVFSVPLGLRLSTGTTLNETIMLTVTPVDSIDSLFNNVAISDVANPALANADGGGNSYSAEALQAAGVVPGTVLHIDGASLQWPDVAAGAPDNIAANGQTVPIQSIPGATALVVLGATTDGPSSGTAVIHYTNGTSQNVALGFSDWTLNAGQSSLTPGETEAIVTGYRNTDGGPSTVTTYVFARSLPIPAGESVESITLPTQQGAAEIHLFALAEN